MKLLGALTILSGASMVYYGLFIHGSEKIEQEGPTYTEPPKPPVLLNDDRQTFTTPGNSQNIVDSNVNNTDTGQIKGYPMPDNINNLKPDARGQIWIMTKLPAFGQEARGSFPVSVDFISNKLVYKQNDGQLRTETYADAKIKLILPDKKYLK